MYALRRNVAQSAIHDAAKPLVTARVAQRATFNLNQIAPHICLNQRKKFKPQRSARTTFAASLGKYTSFTMNCENNIKCIASDLDGTLLPPTKIMPAETFPLIDEMFRRGIIFTPASGRQLPNLKKLFEPALGKIAIIAENGGLCYMGGEVIYCNPTPADDILYALDIIKREKDLFPLCSGVDFAYYDSDDGMFEEVLLRSYSNAKRVDNLESAVKNNTILKISVWDKLPAAEHAAGVLIPKIKGLRTKVSGYDWLDVCTESADKGKALCALMQKLGITKEQCVAFGDHMNDLEMLQAGGRAYVTANAFPELKKYIPNIIPSNAEFGVIKKIKELL